VGKRRMRLRVKTRRLMRRTVKMRKVTMEMTSLAERENAPRRRRVHFW